MIRYRIKYTDNFGVDKYYLNGASSENIEWAKHEIELLKKDNIKFNKGRSNFIIDTVEIKTPPLNIKFD